MRIFMVLTIIGFSFSLSACGTSYNPAQWMNTSNDVTSTSSAPHTQAADIIFASDIPLDVQGDLHRQIRQRVGNNTYTSASGKTCLRLGDHHAGFIACRVGTSPKWSVSKALSKAVEQAGGIPG